MEYIVLESGFTVSGSIVVVFDCKENIPVKSTVLVSMRDDARKWIIKNDGQPVMKNRKETHENLLIFLPEAVDNAGKPAAGEILKPLP